MAMVAWVGYCLIWVVRVVGGWGWRTEGEERDGDGIFLFFVTVVTSRNLIEKIYIM